MTKSQSEMIGSCKVLDLSGLTVSPFNARKQGEESLQSESFLELCDSIKANGLIEPIVVRPVAGRYEVVAGTRRFAALKHIGAKQVPTVVKQMSDNDVRIASLVENIHREGLTEDEKEETLTQIYIVSWDEWKPRDWEKQYYSHDDNKIVLAKQYLKRMHNYDDLALEKAKSDASNRLIFPTPAFKTLKDRVGYAASTQYNILRGYGSYSSDTNFVDELPPTIKELVEKAAKEKKLREDEKQQLARITLTTRKHIKHDIKKPKTQKQKIERTIKRFTNTIERRRKTQEERHKKDQYERSRRIQSAVQQVTRKEIPQPKTEQSAVRAREQIADIGIKLFKTLTGQELETGDLRLGEMQAKSVLATETMKQLATFYAGTQDIAAQQHIIIPLNIALTKYRDILYETGESQKNKDDILRP